jgi:Dolichyl-phosphate-mannose-protein mannosyltransferase
MVKTATMRNSALLQRAAEPGPSSALLLAGMVLIAFVFRITQAGRLGSPTLVCDEFIYAELAKNVAEEGRLLFRGEPLYLSLLYPVLLAPAWFAERMETTYDVAQTINAALMTSAAIPVYLWGRRMMSPGWALLAPALTLVMPMALLAGLIMTESAFLPAFLLAAYAMALALERPTLGRQAFMLVAIGVATAIRFQGVALVATLPTALVIVLALEVPFAREDRLRFTLGRLKPFWPTAAFLAVVGSAYLALQARGRGFGAYEEVARADYTLEATWDAAKLNLADLVLTSGLVPASALILLTLLAFSNGRSTTPAERAFVAVSIPAICWLITQVGLFSSRFAAGTVVERYLFYAAPLLFLALAVWLARGMPRPWLPTAVAAAIPAWLVLAAPLTAGLSEALIPSSLGLFAFHRLAVELGSVDELVTLIRVGVLSAVLAFAVLWRPLARFAIPVGLAAFLLLSSRPAAGHLRQLAATPRTQRAMIPNPQWVDDAVGADEAGYLYTTGTDRFVSSATMLQVNFWNRRVESVVGLGASEICPLPERSARIDPSTGQILTADGGDLPHHLVSEEGLEVDGAVVARQGPLVLRRVANPVRLRQTIDGVYADGWMSSDAAYTRFTGPGAGHAIVDLSREIHPPGSKASAVRVEVGPLVVGDDELPRTGQPVMRVFRMIEPGARLRLRISTPKPPFRLTVNVNPTFSATVFGGGDMRQLSARIVFGFEP